MKQNGKMKKDKSLIKVKESEAHEGSLDIL